MDIPDDSNKEAGSDSNKKQQNQDAASEVAVTTMKNAITRTAWFLVPGTTVVGGVIRSLDTRLRNCTIVYLYFSLTLLGILRALLSYAQTVHSTE